VNTLVDILLQLEGHTVYNNLIKFKYKQYRQKSIQPRYELHSWTCFMQTLVDEGGVLSFKNKLKKDMNAIARLYI
jgi:hypothetical protein